MGGNALAMAGVDLVTIKELLGHTKIDMTMRYAHLSPQHKAGAVERLGERYSSQTPAKEPVSGTDLEQNRNIANAGRRQLTEVASGLGMMRPLGASPGRRAPRFPAPPQPQGRSLREG